LSLSVRIRERLFTVAILGRPNVGKSTLFNRLLGRQRSITDPMPGVTRDVLEGECTIQGSRVRLLDTGGYTLDPGSLEQQVSRRSLGVAGQSDLILLVVEVGGLTREDYELVEQLRRHQKKVVLVVNKVDNPSQEPAVGELASLGFERLQWVSAAHGRGIQELKQIIREAALEAPEGEAGERAVAPRGEAGALRLAILGKPNTGKSTLLNLLVQEERSLVMEEPGTTRDPITAGFRYRDRPFLVIDTAGIRRKSRVSQAVEYYSVNRAIRSIEEADVVLLLIDAREGVSEQDKKIASLAVEKGRGVVLVLNKCDLLGEPSRELPVIEEKVRFFFPMLEFAPLAPISARTGFGVNRLLESASRVGRQLGRRVATNRLNQAVKRWVAEYPLPVRGQNVKIRYATQTGVNPVRFLFFVNTLRRFPSRYLQYMKNRIRRDLGFDRIPVQIELRES
jgi:GTP-binding protein